MKCGLQHCAHAGSKSSLPVDAAGAADALLFDAVLVGRRGTVSTREDARAGAVGDTRAFPAAAASTGADDGRRTGSGAAGMEGAGTACVACDTGAAAGGCMEDGMRAGLAAASLQRPLSMASHTLRHGNSSISPKRDCGCTLQAVGMMMEA